MAVATITPALPLLFDYLLASSWTWFAICLATLATVLRALRVFLLRHRLVPPLTVQPPSAVPVSSSEIETDLLSGSLADKPSPSSFPSQRSFRRRTKSKSTSALEKLHRNGEDFLRSGMELLSAVLDADLSPSLRKISSASKLFHDHSSCEKSHQKMGSCTFSLGTDNRSDQEIDEPCNVSFKEDQRHTDEVIPSWLPSWAYSVCDPLQFTFSSPEDNDSDDRAPIEAFPCFEKQFGWDRLLESRLGSPWNSLAQCSRLTEHSSNVVKMWAGQKKKLVKALGTDALALDVCSQKGLACTGNIAGKVSMWELGRKAYTKALVSFAQPVVALSMNCEQGATIVGSGRGLGLWDHRSPTCVPLGFESTVSANNISLAALKSRGNGLCTADSDNILSMYDLRKAHGKPLYSAPATKREPVSSDSDDEAEFNLLERLSCDLEDNFWDEGSASSLGNGVESQKGISLFSWVASFMRISSTAA